VANEFVDLDERAFVEQHLNALASGVLAFGVLLLNGNLTGSGDCLVVALTKVF
jgi:hypothetical protein